MSTISKPNTFTANTSASASQVNANFDTIYNEFNGNISAANLATDAVTTAKIADSNITTAKIADSAITTAKIADSAITDAKRTRAGYCVVTRTTTQTINNDTATTVQWDSEVSDVGNWHDNSTNNTRITVPDAGVYTLAGQAVWSGMVGEYTYVEFFKNGSAFTPLIRSGLSVSLYDGGFANYVQAQSHPVILAANDYIEMRVYHRHGASRTISTSSWFSVLKLSS